MVLLKSAHRPYQVRGKAPKTTGLLQVLLLGPAQVMRVASNWQGFLHVRGAHSPVIRQATSSRRSVVQQPTVMAESPALENNQSALSQVLGISAGQQMRLASVCRASSQLMGSVPLEEEEEVSLPCVPLSDSVPLVCGSVGVSSVEREQMRLQIHPLGQSSCETQPTWALGTVGLQAICTHCAITAK